MKEGLEEFFKAIEVMLENKTKGHNAITFSMSHKSAEMLVKEYKELKGEW